MKKQNDEITIKGLINIFLPKLWIIILVAVLFGAAFGGYSKFMKKDTYTSSGKYMMSKINYTEVYEMTGLTSSEVDAMQLMIANMQEIVDTNRFANKVIERLRSDYDITRDFTAAEIRPMMKVVLSGDNTTCYYLRVTSDNPEISKAVAEVAGALLVDDYKETKYAVTIDLKDDPTLPTAPDSKNVVRNTVIGFAGGFLLAAIAVFVVSKLDVVIRSREKLEDNIDLPVLGVIPKLESDV
jgi:capsular polysaccharide biosynthesis protein